MNQEEFLSILDHMRMGPVPWRLTFIWSQPETKLKEILAKNNIEASQIDLIANYDSRISESKDSRKAIDNWLILECKKYDAERKEPSALIIRNSLLFARYGCDLSPILQYGISPRSAVLLLMPPDSKKRIPPRAEPWVKSNTGALVTQIATQLAATKFIIRD